MSRSYAMQDIINTISSGEGSKILREYPDFLITHWFRPAHDNYKIAYFAVLPQRSILIVSRGIIFLKYGFKYLSGS